MVAAMVEAMEVRGGMAGEYYVPHRTPCTPRR